MKYLCLIILTFLVSCTNQSNQIMDTPEPGYPISTPTKMFTPPPEGYPVPEIYVPPTILAIPTPSSSKNSTISGYLLNSLDNPSPEVGAILYLVPVILDEDGVPLMAGLSKINDPRSITDENGRFYFADVDKNKHYVLILDRVREAFLLTDPKNGSDLIIFPQDYGIFDLGELIYSGLPK